MNKKLIVPILIAGAAAFCAIGSTYALFTSKDEANIAITSGKVNAKAELVDLVVYSGAANSLTGDPVADEPNIVAQAGTTFANGGTASINNGTLTLTGMTPGDRVSLKIKVTNNSNVSVKGRTSFTMSSNDGLFAALKVKIDGEDFNGLARYGNWAEVTDDVQYIDVVVDFPSDKTMDFGDKSCSINFTYDMLQLNAHTVDPEPNTVQLSTANELVMFSNLVDAKESFAGKTIKLMNDIDMAGIDFNPIGTKDYAVSFDGLFDGGNHTIKNLTVSVHEGENSAAGLFASMHTGSAKNIVLDNANISGDHWTGGIVGFFEGGATGHVVENCVVKNSTIVSTAHLKPGSTTDYDDGDKVGGIAGYVWGSTVKDCSVQNCSITGYRDVGGAVGYASGPYVISGNSVKDVVLTNNRENDYQGYDADDKYDVNEVVGEKYNEATFENNTFDNVSKKIAYVDGFALNAAGEYEISNPKGLVYFGGLVDADQSFAGKTIKLMNDIDMAGIDFDPIGDSTYAVSFDGLFDGGNHTIKNLTVSVHEGENSAAGLFASMHTGSAKNIVLDNANISGDHWTGGIVGFFEGNGAPVLDNCVVKNSTIVSTTHLKPGSTTDYDDGDKVGGIAGYLCIATVQNCSVQNCSITGYRDVGSIIGHMTNALSKVLNCTANTVSLINDRTHNYNGYVNDAEFDVNDIIGESASGTSTGNTATAVTKSVIGA